MPNPSMLEIEYHQRSEALLKHLEAVMDAWLQDDVADIDARRTGGLLEMRCPNGSALIVNTQPPLQEIWLAAKRGGFHFRWVDGAWRDGRSGEEFFALISSCFTEQVGQNLRINAP